jgi:prepilin-type N-terminal cleavage/methylation domain-containing protein
MTGTAKFAAAAKRNADGFTLLELVTVVAILGILAAMATPSMLRMLQQQETKSSATEMAGLLSDARARAVTEGTPYLVYFNPPSVDGNGSCGAAAVEVRDADHSYSITPGDQTREFHLPASACNKVTPLGSAGAAGKLAAVPMPIDDLAVRAPDAGLVGAVASSAAAAAQNAAGSVGSIGSTVVGGLTGSGSSGSGSSSSGEDSSGEDSGSGSNSGSGKSGSAASTTVAALARSSTVSETVVNGATFPVDAASGRPVIAFSERGIPVDPADPSAFGAGAGGIYLTDGDSTVYAALVQPLGDIQLRGFDQATGTWK